ncbi:serine hydrolase domain-containing protein [Aspergillus puulaauensis]|uniref:Beta-lactamase-related domain-containing protein n=1 Tax=Aspergillus puulaauensis TaxID=1220207 RepID=A0A7R7XAW0_9EURO|nr:uncharacterized protein APUU_10698A [Aspergillus puulaauensis]BCS17870.1 hypothetical protein APUU_10698A [Aspergillus puulaauensis]
METLDNILDNATDPTTGILHGAVFIAVDRSGKTIYSRASGQDRLDIASAKLLQLDSLYWIASMTKLVTAIAAMQLVEKGVLDLDDDVKEKVEELRSVKVLRAMKTDSSSGKDHPVLDPVEGKITLRQLLCHTSGFVYDSSSPLLQKWSKSQGRSAYTFSGSMDGYTHPLLFQPGTSWGYGAGLDWAGQLIERVTGSPLSKYMQENIFSKLATSSTTFHHPSDNRVATPTNSTQPPLLEMAYRAPASNTNKSTTTTPEPPLTPAPIILQYPLKQDLGGIGLFSTPADFTSLLSSLLRGGDSLFRQGKESVNLLFAPQLGPQSESAQALPKGLGRQMRRILGASSTDTGTVDHALAGTVTTRDIPGRRRAGSVSWSGLPNLHWWIDRDTGIAGALFTQLMPPADARVTELLIELERALYGVLDGGMRGGVRL